MEVEALPRMEAQISALCDSVARLSVKFDRLEQSLALGLSNRESRQSAAFSAKKTTQLTAQRAAHAKQSAELRHQLDLRHARCGRVVPPGHER